MKLEVHMKYLVTLLSMAMAVTEVTCYVESLIFSSVCIEISKGSNKSGQSISSESSIAESVSVMGMAATIDICECRKNKTRYYSC